MSLRMCAAVIAALFLLAAAPVAQAAKRPAKWKVTDLNASSTTVEPGDSFTLTGELSNRARAKTKKGTVYFGLLEVGSTDRTRLAKRKINRLRGGQTKAFTAQLTVPEETPAGDFVVRICARPKTGAWSRCTRFPFSIVLPGPPGTPPDNRSLSEKLRSAISAESMMRHLRELQRIADNHGGNRTSGFQGYGASVEYVIETLRAAGYSPVTQVFDFVLFADVSPPEMERTAPDQETYDNEGDDAEIATLSYTEAGDTTADIEAIDVNLTPPRASDSGCSTDAATGDPEDDFASFTAGNIALIQRGSCTFYEKALNAQEAGASGVIIFNQGDNDTEARSGVVAGTLGEEAQDGEDTDAPDITIPVVGTTYAIGEDLATRDSTQDVQMRIFTDVSNELRTSTNVLVDTATGDPDETIIVGAHLDGEFDGINDNGTGSALNLELALKMAEMGIQPANRIRFAWWGAEESGLVGATRYVEAISNEDFAQIAMNLNFDMIGSPNHGRFVYDGDFSDTPPPATAPDVNPGAARIEQDFLDYFGEENVDPSAFDGRSDYKPFQDNGIPAGGLFSGAEVAKTADQAARWGGMPNVSFDPNYHTEEDEIDNVNAEGFEYLADGGAHVLAINAMEENLRSRLGTAAGAQSTGASAGAVAERLGDLFVK